MPKKEVSKNDKKEKKENKHFFKDFKAELKRVIWPTPKQLVNNTVAVIIIILIGNIITNFFFIFYTSYYSSSNFNTLKNASCGMSTFPICLIFFLPFFCFSNNFFFLVISPP